MKLILKSARANFFSISMNLFGVLVFLLLLSTSLYARTNIERAFENHGNVPDSVKNSEYSEYVHEHQKTTNLDAIYERGKLRVLLQKKNGNSTISKIEKLLLEEFAKTNNLNLHWIYVDNDWELVTELIMGNGDIIAGKDRNLTSGLHNQINFTHTWASANYRIVQRFDNSRIGRIQDLTGRHVVAYRSSSVWDHLAELSKTLTGMTLQEIPKYDSYQETMERVKTGQYDLAVVNSLFLDEYLISNNELQSSFGLSEKRNMAWAVRSDAEQLHKLLNQYLNKQYHTHDIASVYTDDLTTIKNRGYLRIITNANPSHYFLNNNGSLSGFEYELLREFATKNQLRVDVVIAQSQEEMFQFLIEGKGDIIAASLSHNFLSKNNLVRYTKPYNYASPVIIGRGDDDSIVDTRDLVGKRIGLSLDNPYWEYISNLKKQGLDFELIDTNTQDVTTIMLKIAFGIYDLTISAGHQIRFDTVEEMGLKPQFILFEPVAHRWAVRTKNNQLQDALNTFIENEYRSTKYNLLHAKYFDQQQKRIDQKNELVKVNSLSPYDEVTKYYSEKYGFDWRLIIALMFQESRFNPNANSYAGAKGVMQFTRDTAKFMGLSDTKDVEKSIDAGVRYLSNLRDKFDNSILLHDRMWFAVASYNSGYTRLKKARKVALEMGLDPNKWFQNVELAMLMMAKPYKKNGKKIRNCRCGQTVVYVREIRTRYFNYIRLTETQQLAMLPRLDKSKQRLN